ncbi:MAG: hypothetical protein EAY81_06145 [Bacteroidetes bacterium]|nr:MAG: hypothetical protein EAY81_06145 [Bacteroidota bacterium]
MRLIISIVIILTGLQYLQAQNQNNTWLFGTNLGMKFNNKVMSIIPDKASNMLSGAGCAIISDKTSGSVLLYTNGKQVWDKTNSPMRNGTLLKGSSLSHSISNGLIVDNYNNSYFVFYTNDIDEIYYAFVDLKANGGLGEVVYKDSLLARGMDLQFTAVRLPNQQGHWLITHQKGTNKFLSYRISNNQIYKSPVISVTGPQTYPSTQYNYGKMTSNRAGNRLAYGFFPASGSSIDEAQIAEYAIDKKCGTITILNDLYTLMGTVFANSCRMSYDATGRYLYVSYYRLGDTYELYQYDMESTDPSASKVLISASYEVIGDMQLGDDDKIYIASSQNRTFTSRISVVNSPSSLGAACNFGQNAIELSQNPILGSIGLEHFPVFVHDISNNKGTDNPPKLNIIPACAQSRSSFELQNTTDVICDSVIWVFGDGNSSTLKNTSHVYTKAGTYITKFIWFVCGYQSEIIDTIKIIEQTTFSLGSDTTLCNGVSITLKVPITAQNYLWNTGDTSAEILVKKAGRYQVSISSGNCQSTAEINIAYHPPLFTALNDEYTICDKEKELVKLDAGEGFSTYKWTPTEDTTQWIIVGDLGEYFVVVKDFRGCDGSDGTKVKRRCPVAVYFPNSFSPNNDGINDVYAPVGVDVESFQLKIYNRWGQLVFESDNLNHTWDGTIKGKFVPTDTYIYTAQYTGFIHKKMQTFNTEGNITLIR